jgi:hypothetical protein
MAALALQPWQWGVIAAAWVAFFLLPAIWMSRKARADGDESPFVWTALVLVGSFMGVYEYYHHRSILRRRARRQAEGERRARRQAEGERRGGSP